MTKDTKDLLLNVADYVGEQYPNLSAGTIINMLHEFENTHGERGILGMYNFIQYAKQKDLKELTIKSTIAHDLNGRNDGLMLPRSDSYADLEV